MIIDTKQPFAEITKTEGTTKIIETTGTRPTFHSGIDKSDDHRIIILIVWIITSLFVGSSVFCCIWFVYLQRSKRKNKVRPSSFRHDAEAKISWSRRNENVELTKNDKRRSFGEREKTNTITSIKTKKCFQVVSTVKFESNEVEI